MTAHTSLTPTAKDELLQVLKTRFAKHPNRHQGIDWKDVEARLETAPKKLLSLFEMEKTGGEPDVVARDESTGEIVFYDCSAESPAGRRSICYDREGLESRKEHRPQNSAFDMAEEMGITLLTEEQYHVLQALGNFDLKTSSWLLTPAPLRKLGGALFGDRRYDRVFIYHNGAQSYYGGRGFRGCLQV
jgi:hypothetical protein